MGGARNPLLVIKRAALPALAVLIIANFVGYAVVGSNGILNWGEYRHATAERAVVLAHLNEEKARLAAIEKEKRAEAARKADELARQQAAQQKARDEAAQQQDSGSSSSGSSGSGSSTSTPPADSSYATKADKALAFARAQIGKPYVWGAVGPGSYDCSGLTQAAWKAAGVTLPRTTYDQVNAGTTVPLSQAQPGDLVFFYDDVTHVGIYIGNGMMIHAPKPGTYVREESIFYDGESAIHSVVRPA